MPNEAEIQSTTPQQTMAVMAVATCQLINMIAPRYQDPCAIIEARFDLMLTHVRQIALGVTEGTPEFIGHAANTLQALVDELKRKSAILQHERDVRAAKAAEEKTSDQAAA